MSIADDLKHRLGFVTRDDRVYADRYMQALSQRSDPEARLAAGMAEALVPSDPKRRPDPDGMVRLAVPDLMHDPRPLPTDSGIRRMHIARAVLESAERHVREGSDQGLVPELGRAARTETIRNLTLGDVRQKGLNAALDSRSKTRARTVAAYISDGPPIEKHMERLLEAIPKRGETIRTIERLRENREFHPAHQPANGPELRNWVREGLNAERAAARAGLIEPARIVRIADRTMKDADIESMSTHPRARPDFQAVLGMDQSARQRAFADSKRQMQTPQGRRPQTGVEVQQRSVPGHQAAIHAHIARPHQTQR